MGLLQWGIRQLSETENHLTSIERLLEYAKLDPEPSLATDEKQAKVKFSRKNAKDKLNSIYNEIRKNSFDVICNAEWLIKNNKKRLNFFGPYENDFYKKLITSGNRLSTSASTVKKDFIKKNKILFEIGRAHV